MKEEKFTKSCKTIFGKNCAITKTGKYYNITPLLRNLRLANPYRLLNYKNVLRIRENLVRNYGVEPLKNEAGATWAHALLVIAVYSQLCPDDPAPWTQNKHLLSDYQYFTATKGVTAYECLGALYGHFTNEKEFNAKKSLLLQKLHEFNQLERAALLRALSVSGDIDYIIHSIENGENIL